ncbi:MAG: SMP-30/gluconolactonase/LRE family protein [Myxococcaceae bacterium]|nr:SMP-30/gluconolactonase/LRE family protein [Myxococcaceae bacterium]
MRKMVVGVSLLLAALAGYLGLAPVAVDPVVWHPSADPGFTGAYALNDSLQSAEWLFKEWPGPEAMTFDAQGALVAGLVDGRIVRANLHDKTFDVLANTAGRPLGLKYGPDGRLYICDGKKGLLALETTGQLTTLATEEGGVPFGFTDDLAIARDGTVYFTDATSRFGDSTYKMDLLEHQLTGRVMKYEPATKKVSRVATDLQFANGIALGPDETWLVVVETGSYQLRRVFVSGPRTGEKEMFIENLPGFPDNVTYSKESKTFWVAIASPRNPLVDALADQPFWRKVIARLPNALQPAPQRHAFVLGVDEQGKVTHNFQYRSGDSYSPVTSAIERDGHLYLGSFFQVGVARFTLP